MEMPRRSRQRFSSPVILLPDLIWSERAKLFAHNRERARLRASIVFHHHLLGLVASQEWHSSQRQRSRRPEEFVSRSQDCPNGRERNGISTLPITWPPLGIECPRALRPAGL